MATFFRTGDVSVVRGIVFGGFDCINPGHLEAIRDARLDCDHLTAIISSDMALIERKGWLQHSAKIRKEVLLALPEIDEVIVASECDSMTVIPDIEKLVAKYPNDKICVFCGPGVTPDSVPEEVSGCTYIYTLREKSYSTSKLFDDARAMKMRSLAEPIKGSILSDDETGRKVGEVAEEHSENDYVVLDDCQIVDLKDHPALD